MMSILKHFRSDASSAPPPQPPPPPSPTPLPTVLAPPANLGAPEPAASPPPPDPDGRPDGWGYELLMYGNEQMIQGADNGTLVAFAALAFQQIRGKGEPHQDLACGILLFAVLMCALVHFAIGNAYVGRARKILRGGKEVRRQSIVRHFYMLVAWVAAIVQFFCIVIGVLMILPEKPPHWLKVLVIDRFL